MTPNPLLRLEGIRRTFGRRTILQGVDLQVDAGERVALTGPNGAGKTTLLRIAAGTLRPTAGHVHCDPRRTAYLPQEAPVYRELSVIDHLRFVAKVHGTPWDTATALRDLRDAGLDRLADRPAGTLSRGQRQRLGLTMAFLNGPDLLLLDEPWTALDTGGAAWLTDRIAQSGAAVLAAVHDTSPFPAHRTIHLGGDA